MTSKGKRDWCFISRSEHLCPLVRLPNKSLITSLQHAECKSSSRSLWTPRACADVPLSVVLQSKSASWLSSVSERACEWVCASGLRRFLNINTGSLFCLVIWMDDCCCLALLLIFVIIFRSLSYLPLRQCQTDWYQWSRTALHRCFDEVAVVFKGILI